ncbi:MAG: hypothetical protein ACJ8F7_01225, partial [Gemmataceae bacterium]
RAPFVLEWGRGGRPLPYRVLSARGHRRTGPPEFDPALVPTGEASRPFDFCGHMRRLCAAVVTRCEGLYHIDADRVLITAMQARNGRAAGLQARVTPLRFRDGALTRPFRGREYQVQRFRLEGREQLYVMTFCLPRFLDQPFEEKLVTLFHELFHIGPAFDGDLRRHAGRYEVHSHSQKAYDGKMGELARAYLSGGADPTLHAFLRLTFAQLEHKHGAVVGVVVPRPKLLPVPRVPSPTQY